MEQNLISDGNINSVLFSVFDFTILIMQVFSCSKYVEESSPGINCRKRLGKSPEKSLYRILEHISVSVKLGSWDSSSSVFLPTGNSYFLLSEVQH